MRIHTLHLAISAIILLCILAISCGGSSASGGGTSQKEDITPSIKVSSPSENASNGTYTSSFTVSSTHTWTASIEQEGSWCSIQPSQASSGDTKVTVSLESNSGTMDRVAVITFRIQGGSATCTVTQKGIVFSGEGEDMNKKTEDL